MASDYICTCVCVCVCVRGRGRGRGRVRVCAHYKNSRTAVGLHSPVCKNVVDGSRNSMCNLRRERTWYFHLFPLLVRWCLKHCHSCALFPSSGCFDLSRNALIASRSFWAYLTNPLLPRLWFAGWSVRKDQSKIQKVDFFAQFPFKITFCSASVKQHLSAEYTISLAFRPV
jgi:hypothetical protein